MMRAVVLGLALLAGPVLGQKPVLSADDYTAVWRTCVLTTAEKWAKLNERADVIATGAVGSCASQGNDLTNSLRSGTRPFSFDEAQRMMSQMKVALTEMAVAKVLETRAKKP